MPRLKEPHKPSVKYPHVWRGQADVGTTFRRQVRNVEKNLELEYELGKIVLYIDGDYWVDWYNVETGVKIGSKTFQARELNTWFVEDHLDQLKRA